MTPGKNSGVSTSLFKLAGRKKKKEGSDQLELPRKRSLVSKGDEEFNDTTVEADHQPRHRNELLNMEL